MKNTPTTSPSGYRDRQKRETKRKKRSINPAKERDKDIKQCSSVAQTNIEQNKQQIIEEGIKKEDRLKEKEIEKGKKDRKRKDRCKKKRQKREKNQKNKIIEE